MYLNVCASVYMCFECFFFGSFLFSACLVGFFFLFQFVFIFSYFINMLNACLFSDERARKTMDLGDRANLRGVGGEEMVIRIYCMKNNILSIKKRKTCRKIKVKFNVPSLWSSNSF